MAQPLQELLVVSLEQAVAAPFCTARLADAGARVIKVERSEGDFARDYDKVVNGGSAYFIWLNRGKESLCLNIKDATDKDFLLNLIAKADVFVQNLAPGAASRAGLNSAQLRQTSKRLITVDISGYGNEGPYCDMKAYDLLVQCESGLASVTGTSAAPGRVGVSIADIACGMYAHAAVLEALLQRERTEQGQGLSVSLFDSLADWMTVPLLHQLGSGRTPPRVGLNHPSIAPYGAYDCADGEQLVIAVQNNREWKSFCEHVLHKPSLGQDLQYLNNSDRVANRKDMNADINDVVAQLTRVQLIERLQLARIAYGAVNSVADLALHPQLRTAVVKTESGDATIVSPPPVSTEGAVELRPVPALGEHGAAIRREFGES